MGRGTGKLCGLVLVGLLSLIPARGAAQEPPVVVPLATLSVRDGPQALTSLARAVGPLPEELPAEHRLGLGIAWLALAVRAGRSPRELVEILIPSAASLAVVTSARGPALVFVTRVRDREAADSLLDELSWSMPRRWRDDVLAIAAEPRVLESVPVYELLEAAASARPAAASARPAAASAAPAATTVAADLVRVHQLSDRGGGALSEGLDGANRFLFGPWVRIWERADHLGGELLGTEQGLKLRLRLDATLEGDPWQKLTARGEAPRAVPAPPENTIAFISLDRQLEGLFRNLDLLLSEEDEASARIFLSTADQFLLGGYFVDDLLGSLAEPIHLYLMDFAPSSPPELRPGIQLPAFALVASVPEDRIGQVKKMLEQVSRTISFLINSQRSDRGQSSFGLNSVSVGDLEGLVAEPSEWLGSGPPTIEHGLSPTLLVGHGHVILSSTLQGAEAIAGSLADGRMVELSGDYLEVRGPTLASALRRNLSVLELSRVLDEGETMTQAKRFWKTSLAVLDAIAVLRLETRSADGATEAELTLRRR